MAQELIQNLLGPGRERSANGIERVSNAARKSSRVPMAGFSSAGTSWAPQSLRYLEQKHSQLIVLLRICWGSSARKERRHMPQREEKRRWTCLWGCQALMAVSCSSSPWEIKMNEGMAEMFSETFFLCWEIFSLCL